MGEQLKLANKLQERIDFYSDLIRVCRKRWQKQVEERNMEGAVRETFQFSLNQLVLKELLACSIDVLDADIWFEHIHCDEDVQEPLVKLH